jgi:Histidine kinase-, DNA gyrase B-, and HSP90-like ATPase
VLNRSLQAAVGAAAEEAATRTAGIALLMGVARRPQRPLQRGLQVIEDLQNRIGDESLLAELFDINHQLAQTRRFLENLIILAGGQTGRRFHRPIPIRRVLLAAIAETQQYQRITIRRAADVALAGNAVAGTTHMLAELLDNALAFSPPQSEVWVSCSRTAQGVVVEIEDSGVGMIREDLDRANELLANAPTPDVTALKDGSQVGLWVVAALAKRGGMRVTLRMSAYGGLLAIVLVPERLIVTDTDPFTAEPTDAMSPVSARGYRADRTRAALVAGGSRSGPSPVEGDARRELSSTAAAAVLTATAGHDSGPARLVPEARANESHGTNRTDGMTADQQPNGSATNLRRTGSAPPPVISAELSWRPPVPRSPLPEHRATPPESRPPLPERRPQQHLAPELRDGDPADAVPPEPVKPVRSPEETRDRLERYQRGWRAGSSSPTGSTEAPRPDQTRQDV